MYDASSGAFAPNANSLPTTCEENKARKLTRRWNDDITEDWDADMIAVVIRDHRAGLTSTETVRNLFRECRVKKSRSAVCGKRHRLGLFYDEKTARILKSDGAKSVVRYRSKNRPRPKKTNNWTTIRYMKDVAEAVYTEPPADPLIIDGALRTIATLEFGECKFPFGDPKRADFCFCARPRAGEGLSYCPEHMRVTRSDAKTKSLNGLARIT